jgi:NADPH:quinone reductase-like Zn-dependent oxidoreductase
VDASGIRPTISAIYSLPDAREGFAQLAGGDVIGKIVITP